MNRRVLRWLYRRTHRFERYEPMLEGPLFTRLILTGGSITDQPKSAMQ